MAEAGQTQSRPDLRAELAPDGAPYADGSYIRILCPYHGDTTKAGGAVYEDHFYCFTCGAWIPRYEFLKRLEQGDIEPLAAISNYDEQTAYLPPDLGDQYAAILQGPRADRKEWFYERGISEKTLRIAKIGHTGRAFTIPVFASETLAAIKYRHDPEFDTCADECSCPKYWGVRGRNSGLLYDPSGVLAGLPSRGPVVLTEGELDALLLTQYGIPAVSSINGARDLTALNPLRGTRSVVVAYDVDGPGQSGALRVRDYLGNARIVVWHAPLGGDGKVHPKDVTEFIQARGIDAFRRLAKV